METLIIRSGKVYNPARHEWNYKDTMIKDGRIMGGLPSGDYEVVDAPGCIIATGLTDYHVRYFNRDTENGVNPDATSFPHGIAIVVDEGSCGVTNYETYRRSVISFSDVHILNMLLMGSRGQTANRYPEHTEERYLDRDRIRALFRTYPDSLVGLKLRLSTDITGENETGKSLRAAVAIAEEFGCNICVYITDLVMDLGKLAGMLYRNDVICHVYQGKGRETILDENGMVRKGTVDAKERGVLFDANNGCSSYSLEVSRKTTKWGFIPGIISSDISTAGFYLQPPHSLSRIMSKYLDMGMCLEKMLDIVIVRPTRSVGKEELASLDMSGTVDMVILKLAEKEVCYRDRKGHTFTGHQVIVPQMTVKGGEVIYYQADFI